MENTPRASTSFHILTVEQALRALDWEVLLLAGIMYVPFLQNAFGMSGFGPVEWFLLLGVATPVVPIIEATKWMERRGWFGEMS